MFQLGLKIGSKDTQYTDEILRYYDEGVFQYIELFAISGTLKETIDYWKQFNIPFGIHAPHSMAGLNLANSFSKSENSRKIIETIRFADELNAEYIIFHSGMNGTCVEVVNQLKPFCDNRFIIENKPIKGIGGGICVGTQIPDLKYIIDSLNCGFCLDFGHAICSARTQNADPIEFIKSLKEQFNPRVYHLTDGDYESELDSHLHYGEGCFPLKELLKFVPDGAMVTNEAKREKTNCLIEVLQDSFFLRKQ